MTNIERAAEKSAGAATQASAVDDAMAMQEPTPPLLSVVIPLYNEVDNVMLLADEVASALLICTGAGS